VQSVWSRAAAKVSAHAGRPRCERALRGKRRASLSPVGIENPVHLLFVAVIALIVLGPRRLPELARAVGKGVREFREAVGGASLKDPPETEMAALPPGEPVVAAAPEPDLVATPPAPPGAGQPPA
jgi:sec-independent protein translocase protein TatA